MFTVRQIATSLKRFLSLLETISEGLSVLLPPLAGNYKLFSNPVCREGSVKSLVLQKWERCVIAKS